MSRWVRVTELTALEEENRPYAFEAEGEPIVLIRKGDTVYAFRDVCTHMEYPLHDGTLEDEYVIRCAYHGARFDIRTGDVLSMPAFEPVQTYPVRITDGIVWIDVEPEAR